MKFQESDNSMPAVIYEGYKCPTNYAVFGEANLHELNEDNSSATVYIGNRFDINILITEINNTLEDFEEDGFIIIGLWDNNIEKSNDDYVMLATIISHNIDNPLEYIDISKKIHQLTDNSTSDSDAWRAWGNLCDDYSNNSISQAETEKVAKVLLENVSDKMLNNFKQYMEDDFLQKLVPSVKKLKI